MSGVLVLALARARQRPGRFVIAALGVAVAIAFAGAVLAEATIAGDEAARGVLAQSSTLARAVRVDWSGPSTLAVAGRARRTLAVLGLPAQGEVVLLSPVRLGGVVVNLAAIAPLGRWLSGAPAPGPCRTADCPMLLVGRRLKSRELAASGVRVPVAGSARLRSAAPLGFVPTAGQAPLLITGDVAGLDRLPALSGVYRTHSWLSVLATGRLHSWNLAPLQHALQRTQVELTGAANGFNFSGPFDALDSARARVQAAPRGLLLTGGGALAALAVFIVLAGAALRTGLRAELGRLTAAGARRMECAALALLEAGWVGALAVLCGAAAALAAGAVLAAGAGAPAGDVIRHSLLTIGAGAGAAGAWIVATVVLAALIGLPRRVLVAVADGLAVAALAALTVALVLGGSSHASALLLAPLVCLTAGLILVRGVGLALRVGERLARRGPPLVRVAALALARGPGLESVAIAFIAISIGLGGFALCYRATLDRSAADQAANRVPLDARVAAGSDFVTPLRLAPLSRWSALAGGAALPVRRTEVTYPSGGQAVTEPALGVPAAGLRLMHGWRQSDASASLSQLARRLVPPGPPRIPGPVLPAGTRWLTVSATSPSGGTEVTADLRGADGLVDQVPLGEALPSRSVLRAAIPAGRWELEALELGVPAGAEATEGHQMAENPAPPATNPVPVQLGTPRALDRRYRQLAALSMSGWRGVGAASVWGQSGGGLSVGFAQSGSPGVLREPQPSDRRPLPLLADARTAAAAGPGNELPLTIDGLSIRGRVVGVLSRFPTLPANAAGFVIADAATLDAALDAQQPGQGRPDELWLSATHIGRLRAALSSGALAQLDSSFRSDIERALRNDPVARGVEGTLIAAAVIALALALVGLQAVLLGTARNARREEDLAGLGVGPSGLRTELRLRLGTAAASGVIAGAAVAVLLTGLAVAAVGSALGVSRPAVVAIVPLAALALWILAALGALGLTSFLATAGDRRWARP